MWHGNEKMKLVDIVSSWEKSVWLCSWNFLKQVKKNIDGFNKKYNEMKRKYIQGDLQRAWSIKIIYKIFIAWLIIKIKIKIIIIFLSERNIFEKLKIISF